MVRDLCGRGARRARTIAVAGLTVGLTACSGDDAPPPGAEDDDASTTVGSTSGDDDDDDDSNPASSSEGGGTTRGTAGSSTSGEDSVGSESTSDSGDPGTTSTTTMGAGPSSDSAGTTEGGTTEGGSTDGTSTTDGGTTDGGTTDGGTTEGGTTDGGTTAGTTGGPPVCFDVDLMGSLEYVGTTIGEGDDHQGSCVANPGAPDFGHYYVAEEAGFYEFTVTADHDPTLTAMLGDDCFAPELQCDDDFDVDDALPRISEYLPADTELLLIVDGAADGEEGPYTLTVQAEVGPCYQSVVTTAGDPPWIVAGDNSDAVDHIDGSCSEVQGGREVIFRFTPPVSDVYTISTIGSSYDTVVYLREASCSLLELACDDDSGIGLTSLLDVSLEAGQETTIVVDAFDALDGGHFIVAVDFAD